MKTRKTKTFEAGARIRFLARNSRASGGVEWHYGNVCTGESREMREDGIGEPEPHVRVLFEGDADPCWYPTRRLKLAPAAA